MAFLVFAAVLRQPVLSAPRYGGARASAEVLRQHVDFLAKSVLPRSAAHPENLDRAAAYIADAFRRAGAEVVEQPFRARGRVSRNVIARFGPRDARQPLLVVGAHYDAFGETGALPGADDNASGTAGLLELARILRDSNVHAPVELVAFTTEEPPFFGSEEMGSAVHAASLAGRPVRGMISLEMIGVFSGEQTWPSPLFAWLYTDRSDFIAVAGGWSDRALARQVKRGIRGVGGVDVYSFSGARELSDASDQRSHWARGWTAVIVTDTEYLRNPRYHTNRDTAETLDYALMARVVDGVANAVITSADR
ncbi:MAG: M28 family peptidase [Acidobacteria bacterium]|nr:M28 family peptidase [Acidobacteriota bacterium]MBV9478056.1 M28 family peptidase [Acidobacteriota bacterium]